MIILASQSPYRKILLEKTGFSFKAESPLVDEELLKKEFVGSNQDLIKFLAFKKAESLSNNYKDYVIIGSDQALLFDGHVIGKSHNYENAKKQLSEFSEKTVELLTAVSLIKNDQRVEFENSTTLHFKKLSEEFIDWYLKTDEPYDCAGSFKMESSGAVLFNSVECSDPTAIQGLPLMRLSTELKKLGV